MEGFLLILLPTHLFTHTNAEHVALWYKPRLCKLFLSHTELQQCLTHRHWPLLRPSVVIWSSDPRKVFISEYKAVL